MKQKAAGSAWDSMTAQDLADIQTRLGSSLPEYYIKFMLSGGPRLRNVFYDRKQIIEANLDVRKKCWRGDPLDRFFYVFGRDEENRVLFLDLDLPGGAVLQQDDSSSDPSHRANVLSLSFEQWTKSAEQVGGGDSA
jgi:hypothetical protein